MSTINLTGTIVDSDSQAWAQAIVTATLVGYSSPQGRPRDLTGALIPTVVSTVCADDGSFTLAVNANSNVGLPGTSWMLEVQPNASVAATNCGSKVFDATADISSFINDAIVAPRIESKDFQRAYSTTEIVGPSQGDVYVNTSGGEASGFTLWMWDGVEWVEIGGGGGGGGLTGLKGDVLAGDESTPSTCVMVHAIDGTDPDNRDTFYIETETPSETGAPSVGLYAVNQTGGVDSGEFSIFYDSVGTFQWVIRQWSDQDNICYIYPDTLTVSNNAQAYFSNNQLQGQTFANTAGSAFGPHFFFAHNYGLSNDNDVLVLCHDNTGWTWVPITGGTFGEALQLKTPVFILDCTAGTNGAQRLLTEFSTATGRWALETTLVAEGTAGLDVFCSYVEGGTADQVNTTRIMSEGVHGTWFGNEYGLGFDPIGLVFPASGGTLSNSDPGDPTIYGIAGNEGFDADNTVVGLCFVANDHISMSVDGGSTVRYKLAAVSQSNPTRALGTIYQNTSGQNMMVNVILSFSALVTATTSFQMGPSSTPSSVSQFTDTTAASSTTIRTHSVVVPPGSHYQCTATNGSITEWTETLF